MGCEDNSLELLTEPHLSADIAPDGEHFVMLQSPEGEEAPASGPIVLNWFDELRRLVPTH